MLEFWFDATAWLVDQLRSLHVAVLFLAAWVAGGGAMLWAGGRFIAGLPKVTFWRSLVARGLQGLCAGLVLSAAQQLATFYHDAGRWVVFLTAAGITAGTLVVFWVIIMWLFRATFYRAILAWLPMMGEALIVFLMALAVPVEPFWP